MEAFVMWAVLGIAFIFLGIYDMLSKKEVAFGFWANAKMWPVTDVKRYNRALGRLFILFGAVFILLGIPLLPGMSAGLIIIPIVGTMFEAIAAMVVYTVLIEKKYRRGDGQEDKQ